MTKEERKELDKKLLQMSRSKVVRFNLVEDVINLRMSGMSAEQIAEELNASGKLPHGEIISGDAIRRFLERVPEIRQELIRSNRDKLMETVNTGLDIVYETSNLFHRTKELLGELERQASKSGRVVNPYQYKALVSEMRELLKQMMDINKEINDYENIKKFMEIVLSVLKEECPDKIPIIAERLKMAKGTQWFSSIIRGKGF